MLFEPVWSLLQQHLFPAPSTDRLFNPYRDRHPDLDVPDAPTLRRRNLHAYLRAYRSRPPLFLLAEAPGPWGCRFSGVPLVSEAQLLDEAFPLSGARTSTAPQPYGEYSARIYWRVLGRAFPHFFTWNTVPLHPHRAGEPFTIRTPTAREAAQFTPLLADLVALLQPAEVLAVGRKAEAALEKVGAACTYVRHPSQGGARLFATQVSEILQAQGLADPP